MRTVFIINHYGKVHSVHDTFEGMQKDMDTLAKGYGYHKVGFRKEAGLLSWRYANLDGFVSVTVQEHVVKP